jgi:hypothetical protein
MEEHKDHRLKYVEMSAAFAQKALELEISAKQQSRSCGEFAKKIAKLKTKTGEEFERVEAMKDFIIRTATMNDNVLDLIGYVKSLIVEVCADTDTLIEGSKARDSLRDAQITIELMIQQRDKNFKDEYDRQRNQIIAG